MNDVAAPKTSGAVLELRGIRRVFEMADTKLEVLKGAELRIAPGEIVALVGPSGAGKTSLLSLLVKRLSDCASDISGLNGAIKAPAQVPISVLTSLSSTRPLINSLGPVSFEHALFALNVSGLAEAHLYVKRFKELSNGQRYRAMVARLIASGAALWVADEFCATLDPVTANIVCRNLRRCAKRLGVTVFLAAANWSEFIYELKPDVVVYLRAPWDSQVFSWKQFDAAVRNSQLVIKPEAL